MLLWRDLLALLRAPYRLAWSAALALAAAGLAALAVRSPRDSVLPLALALSAGYLAAAGLCEGARLDADDPRRSGGLPFRFRSLPWRHAGVPWLALTVLAGGPAAALAVACGHPALIGLLPAATAALTGGAMVNAFRGQLEGEMFGGFDTPAGNSSGVTITLWYVTGPLLAIAPMIPICRAALLHQTASGITTTAVLCFALAAWLGRVSGNRAARLGSW